tara:strand:+ start:61 stop:678 length:618 start_codon:yes stop_codon:yes gene_type:complete
MRKIFCLLGILFSTSALAVENTAEVWSTNKVSAPLHGKHLSFAVEQEIRARNSYGIYYSHSDFGIYNNSLDNISFSLNFREVFETRDGWFAEHRPHFNVGCKDSFGKFVLSNRFRVELRTYEIYDTSMRYRNKLEFGLKVKKSYFFVNDEIFFTHSDVPRNRNCLGMSYKTTDSLKLSLSYLLQQNFKEVLILNHAAHIKFGLKI